MACIDKWLGWVINQGYNSFSPIHSIKSKHIHTCMDKSRSGFRDRWDRIINVCSMKRPEKGFATCSNALRDWEQGAQELWYLDLCLRLRVCHRREMNAWPPGFWFAFKNLSAPGNSGRVNGIHIACFPFTKYYTPGHILFSKQIWEILPF